jgi:hypothetical protein
MAAQPVDIVQPARKFGDHSRIRLRRNFPAELIQNFCEKRDRFLVLRVLADDLLQDLFREPEMALPDIQFGEGHRLEVGGNFGGPFRFPFLIRFVKFFDAFEPLRHIPGQGRTGIEDPAASRIPLFM